MKLTYWITLAIFCAVTPLRAGDDLEFFTHLIDSFPKPAEKEFSTPESVVRAYIQGILDGRTKDTFKCVPLSKEFTAQTWENEIHYIGDHWEPRMGAPDDYYKRFIKGLEGHFKIVNLLRYSLLAGMADESVAALMDKTQSPPNKDAETVANWLKDLSAKISLSNLNTLKIRSVEAQKRTSDYKYLGALTFTEVHNVTAYIKLGDKDVNFDFLVGMLDGNYQIIDFLNLPH